MELDLNVSVLSLEAEQENLTGLCVASFFRLLLSPVHVPSKNAGSDPEAFWLRPVMAITASMRPQSGRIVYAGSYFSHAILSRSSKEGLDHTVPHRPGSHLDGLLRFWPNASGPEASRCARIIGPSSGRRQTAHYHFPTFRLGYILSQTVRILLCKTRPDPIGFWLTVPV